MASTGITVFSATEAIRRRPGMYVGDPADGRAMHVLLWELVGLAIDDHVDGGGATFVSLSFDDERVTFEHDGRGIPIDLHPDENKSVLELELTVLSPGNRIRLDTPVRRSLHGLGLPVVNALSDELHAEVWQGGRRFEQRHGKGQALGPVMAGEASSRTGLRVSFTPDFTILAKVPWDVERVAERCDQLAALLPSLRFIVQDDEFCYAQPVAYVESLAGDEPLVDPLRVNTARDGIGIDVTLAWTHQRGSLLGFVNYEPVALGSHVDGLFAGLRAALGARSARLRSLTPAKFRALIERNAIALVHVTLPNPQFPSQDKSRLLNPEVKPAVRAVIADELAAHFDRAPALLDSILIAID